MTQAYAIWHTHAHMHMHTHVEANLDLGCAMMRVRMYTAQPPALSFVLKATYNGKEGLVPGNFLERLTIQKHRPSKLARRSAQHEFIRTLYITWQ